jgi:hypothetical protein
MLIVAHLPLKRPRWEISVVIDKLYSESYKWTNLRS